MPQRRACSHDVLVYGTCRHPCLQYFKYTTGAVLASLAKDDLRRQCKDEEAANIIWHELNAHRKSMAEKQEIEETSPQTYLNPPASYAPKGLIQ